MQQNLEHIIQSFVKEQKLFPPKTPLLIACSGGPDSMAAVEILTNLGYPLGIAHCNFKLRGENANGDQDFVEAYAKERKIPFFTISFNTEIFAFKNRLSIQAAARELRYTWLEEVRKANGFHFIVTAHHKEDVVETLLLNAANKTGIKGLKGIPVKNEKIVRPLFPLSKTDILEYLSVNEINYREDESNASTKYTRNFIRQEVIPVLEKVNDKAVDHLFDLSQKANEAEFLLQERMVQIKRKIIFQKQETIEVKFGYVLNHASGKTILYEILKDFGFNSDQALAIYNSLESQSGIEFLSATHRIIKDRKSLFVNPLASNKVSVQQYDKIPNQILFNTYKIKIDQVPIDKSVLKQSANYAFFDLDKIEFPLTIRYWKPGDYFYPFGMTKQNSDKIGKKKLSKYFKDEKFSVNQKENLPVLFSGEKMIWLVGHRIDDRFKVTEETKIVLKLKIVKQ